MPRLFALFSDIFDPDVPLGVVTRRSFHARSKKAAGIFASYGLYHCRSPPGLRIEPFHQFTFKEEHNALHIG